MNKLYRTKVRGANNLAPEHLAQSEVRGVIFNPIVSGGGGSKQYKFTYDYDGGNNTPPTLDGELIDVGDTFDLEAGSMHVLYTNAEAAAFETESGKAVPYIVSESAPTRAVSPNSYVSFVMPDENCRYWY